MTQFQGFDVSHFQSTLTAEKVKELSRTYSFCGLKCSEGTYQHDIHFDANREACRANRFPRWIYHEVTIENPTAQLQRIMEASRGVLYPRERFALALGDFGAPLSICATLRDLVATRGPVKRIGHEPPYRPVPVLYANLSNFKGIYSSLPGPRIVAEFPNTPDIPCVIHQNATHDSATGGDHEIWIGGQGTGTDIRDLQRFFSA